MNSQIASSSFSVRDFPSILSDVFSYVITRTDKDHYNPEAQVSDLMTLGAMRTELGISVLASLICEQARLVYFNYHSTSIHLIPLLYQPLKDLLPVDDPTFRSDLTNYDNIKTLVESCPYIGVRSYLPQKFQIRTMPCLVYGALLYYARTLTTEQEKLHFAAYKVDKVKAHITPYTKQKYVQTIIQLLPNPSVTAELLQVLDLEKGTHLADSLDDKTRREILNMLRHDPNPGPWANDRIMRENADYINRLISRKLTDPLDKFLRLEYDSRVKLANHKPTPEQRIQALQGIEAWNAQIRRQIEDMVSLADRLPAISVYGQDIIRNELAIKVSAIYEELMDQQPAPANPQ